MSSDFLLGVFCGVAGSLIFSGLCAWVALVLSKPELEEDQDL